MNTVSKYIKFRLHHPSSNKTVPNLKCTKSKLFSMTCQLLGHNKKLRHYHTNTKCVCLHPPSVSLVYFAHIQQVSLLCSSPLSTRCHVDKRSFILGGRAISKIYNIFKLRAVSIIYTFIIYIISKNLND